MKNYFVVVRGRNTGIYENEGDAKAQIHDYYDGKYKGFNDEEKALSYFNNYNQNEGCKKILYAVKIGRRPGIYTDREQAGKQVQGFSGAWIRKYEYTHLNLAQEFLASNLTKETYEREMARPKIKAVKQKKKQQKLLKEDVNLSKPLIFEEKYVCFMDCEANNGQVISIGAYVVDVDSMQVIDSFYSLCKPRYFEKMDTFCKQLTKISTEEVLKADDFKLVYNRFCFWLKKYDCKTICTWSGSDQKFMKSTISKYDVKWKKEICFLNIQKPIGYSVFKNKTVGLKDMKKYYGMEEYVNHHALKDAEDMVKVYFNYFEETKMSLSC